MTPPPDVQCDCLVRGMTGGKAHPLCPVHGTREAGVHECFDLDGARVHGDPDMSDESRDALREIIAAAKKLMEDSDATHF